LRKYAGLRCKRRNLLVTKHEKELPACIDLGEVTTKLHIGHVGRSAQSELFALDIVDHLHSFGICHKTASICIARTYTQHTWKNHPNHNCRLEPLDELQMAIEIPRPKKARRHPAENVNVG
jgi:hypothetical protein